jgi:hypothetical protein
MQRIVSRTVLAVCLLAGCAETPPTESAMTAKQRTAPGKCSACHLAPKEHSLAATQWETYLKNHKRRLRLTEEEKTFLYDFLIGGTPPAATIAPQGEPQEKN